MRVFSIDRIPLLALGGLIIMSFAGANYYMENAPTLAESPFRPVWVTYDSHRALELTVIILLALACAALPRLTKPVSTSWPVEYNGESAASAAASWQVLAIGGVALGLFAKGEFLFYAPAYLSFAAPSPVVSLYGVLAPVVLIASGVVSERRPRVGFALALLMTMILFAGATRLMAGALVLFISGRWLGGGRTRPWAWLLSAAFAAVFLPIPLAMRNAPAHGLIPYASFTKELFMQSGYVLRITDAVSENVGFTVPLLVHVADYGHISPADMMVQVNPAPAALAGWNDLMPAMRVHWYIPYSMLGEFAHFGSLSLFAAVFAWGILTRLCIQLAALSSSRISLLLLVGELGMALMSVLYASQYNTRSVARILWMMLLVILMSRLLDRVGRLPSPSDPRHQPQGQPPIGKARP